VELIRTGAGSKSFTAIPLAWMAGNNDFQGGTLAVWGIPEKSAYHKKALSGEGIQREG
jgi:hypothetical protein